MLPKDLMHEESNNLSKVDYVEKYAYTIFYFIEKRKSNFGIIKKTYLASKLTKPADRPISPLVKYIECIVLNNLTLYSALISPVCRNLLILS